MPKGFLVMRSAARVSGGANTNQGEVLEAVEGFCGAAARGGPALPPPRNANATNVNPPTSSAAAIIQTVRNESFPLLLKGMRP